MWARMSDYTGATSNQRARMVVELTPPSPYAGGRGRDAVAALGSYCGCGAAGAAPLASLTTATRWCAPIAAATAAAGRRRC